VGGVGDPGLVLEGNNTGLLSTVGKPGALPGASPSTGRSNYDRDSASAFYAKSRASLRAASSSTMRFGGMAPARVGGNRP
jgi:hypothetical protein